jgi:hypothetical protein
MVSDHLSAVALQIADLANIQHFMFLHVFLVTTVCKCTLAVALHVADLTENQEYNVVCSSAFSKVELLLSEPFEGTLSSTIRLLDSVYSPSPCRASIFFWCFLPLQ